MSETLKPCPFCGGDAAFNTTRYSEDCDTARLNGQTLFHGVNCVVCGGKMHGIVGYKTKGRAAAAWNRRAESAAVAPEAGEREDTARLDALAAFIEREGGIVLHNGLRNGERLPFPGLGLRNTGRSLRVAIDSSLATQPESAVRYPPNAWHKPESEAADG